MRKVDIRMILRMVNDLDYAEVKFPVSKKIIAKLNRKKAFALMYFVMKMVWPNLFIYQMKNLKIAWSYD